MYNAKVSMAGPIPMRTVATVRVPDPDNTVGRLAALGERLSLPAGWEYRVLTLEQDLVVRADAKGGPAHIVLDEYKGNYQRIDNA